MGVQVKRSLPRKIVARMCNKGVFDGLSDQLYLPIVFWAKVGYRLNLRNPKTYNEKLNWMKLYYRKPELTQMVDKYEAKKYVAERIGEEYIIPTYGVWDSFDEIDFDVLPDQFVLKCTHDSGSLVICRDKQSLDRDAAKKKLETSLQRDYYLFAREWPYKNVKHRILAEAYMMDEKTGELRDYKFYAFNGIVKIVGVFSSRQNNAESTRADYFDDSYSPLPIHHAYKHSTVLPEKPSQFEKMKELAGKLSEGFPHMRVDLYEVNGRVYFGELTPYNAGGLLGFEPEEWEKRMGQWIELPSEKII